MDDRIMAHLGKVLDVVFSILADGKPRSTAEIVAEARRQRLLPERVTPQQISGALSLNIERALLHGRKPFVVQDPDRRFRLNRPIDDWPEIDTTSLAPLAAPAEAPAGAATAIAALRKAASGSDSVAFEVAVCSTFEIFGFAATHLGAAGQPDGYADALLGELRYRVMIECKLLGHRNLAESSAPAEAARHREDYHGDYCVVVAPALDAEPNFVAELRTHGVAAWTVDDLARAAVLRLDCSRLRPFFAPGFAANALDDYAWEHLHGSAKRLRVVASLLLEIGLAQQRMAHTVGDAAPPRLTADVALSLVDERLMAAGSANGVTREEIDAAFTWLTSPYVDRAVWSDESYTAIIVRPELR